jgi:hypothetical protein
MTTLDSPTAPAGLADIITSKLQGAASPLKLADVAKGLPRPRKVKAADFQNEIRTVLDDQIRLGLAFRYASGKGGLDRYWSRDERNLLRVKAVEIAAAPLTLVALKKKLGQEIKGVDGAFIDAVVRELINDDKLFEHPAGKKSSLFGITPAPSPLEQPKARKVVDKLVAACRKLLTSTNVPIEDLLHCLRERLTTFRGDTMNQPAPTLGQAAVDPPPVPTTMSPAAHVSSELDELILKAVANVPVSDLAELRDSMPAEYRGPAFDEAILRLAGECRIIVYRDAEAARFSEDERSRYVQDGTAVYTTISKRD